MLRQQAPTARVIASSALAIISCERVLLPKTTRGRVKQLLVRLNGGWQFITAPVTFVPLTDSTVRADFSDCETCEHVLCPSADSFSVEVYGLLGDGSMILLAQADTAFSHIVPNLGTLAASVSVGDARRAFIAPCELPLSPSGSVRLNVRTCLSHYTFPLELPAVQPAFMHELIQSSAPPPAAQQALPQSGNHPPHHAPPAFAASAPLASSAGMRMHAGMQPLLASAAPPNMQGGFPFGALAGPQGGSLVQPVVAPPLPGDDAHAEHSSQHRSSMMRESSAGSASDHGSTTSFPFSMVSMKAKSWVGFEEGPSHAAQGGATGQPNHNWGRTAANGGMSRQLSADAALGQYNSTAWDDFVIHSGATKGPARVSEPSHMGLPQTGLGTGTGTSAGGSFFTAQHEEARASVDDLLGESDAADLDISGFVIPSGQGMVTDRVSSFGHDSFVSAGNDDLSLGHRAGGGNQLGRLERSGTNQSGVSDHADVAHVPGVTQDSAWPVPSGRAFHSSFS